MDREWEDRAEIRAVIENWAIWRDYGDWERLRTCWHGDGRMHTVWFQGPAADFIAHASGAKHRGGQSAHFLGGISIDLAGARAIAQTKMQILLRGPFEGVLCDATSTSRFYDFFDKRGGRWAIALRQVIYEKDRIDPVDPAGPRPKLDDKLLAEFPEGFRHMGYAQVKSGWNPKRDTPTLRGPEVERLYARGKAWLAGGPLEIE